MPSPYSLNSTASKKMHNSLYSYEVHILFYLNTVSVRSLRNVYIHVRGTWVHYCTQIYVLVYGFIYKCLGKH